MHSWHHTEGYLPWNGVGDLGMWDVDGVLLNLKPLAIRSNALNVKALTAALLWSWVLSGRLCWGRCGRIDLAWQWCLTTCRLIRTIHRCLLRGAGCRAMLLSERLLLQFHLPRHRLMMLHQMCLLKKRGLCEGRGRLSCR